METTTIDLIDVATDYACESIAVIPLLENKAPAINSDEFSYLYNRMNESEIKQYFTRASKIGIACGEPSGGIECIDFDCHAGENATDTFDTFASNEAVKHIMFHYDLPVFRTPSGGYHLLFRNPDPFMQGQKLAYWKPKDETKKPGVKIETRGYGQYIAVYPSKGYKQLRGVELICTPEITEDERDTLYRVAESLNEVDVIIQHEKQKGGVWPDKFNTDISAGKFSEDEPEYALNLLREAGWKMIHTRRDGVQYWQRPGKDSGASATYGKLHNMFYIFSSDRSVDPFRDLVGYSPFDILKLLQFNGNKKEAEDWLNKRYNFIPPEPIVQKIEPQRVISEPEPIQVKPVFPVEVFPESIVGFINELNRTLNYSKDFCACSIMSVIASLNGNKYKLKVKNGWISPTIFWFALIGEPGTLKTHPMKTILKPLDKIDAENLSVYEKEYADYQQRLEYKEKGLKRPRFAQIKIQDTTLEALHQVHSINKRGILLFKDELVSFLNDMNRYRKGSDEQFWLESFNNSSYMVNRVTKEPMYIEEINIGLLGGIQPDVLNQIISEHDGNGLTDRFLYTTNETEIYPTNMEEAESIWFIWWENCVRTLHETFDYIDTESTIINTMSIEAMQRFMQEDIKYCKYQGSDQITGQMKNYFNKMKTYLPRFALLLNIIDTFFADNVSFHPVTLNQMERACTVVDYFIKSAAFIFNTVERQSEIAEVSKKLEGQTKAEKILSLYHKGFKQVEISRKLKTPKSYVSKIIASVQQ